LSIVSFFGDIASELLYQIMPLYLKSIGMGALFIGILEGLADAISGISKSYFLKLSDVKRSILRRHLGFKQRLKV
jgi:hypothetical protein